MLLASSAEAGRSELRHYTRSVLRQIRALWLMRLPERGRHGKVLLLLTFASCYLLLAIVFQVQEEHRVLVIENPTARHYCVLINTDKYYRRSEMISRYELSNDYMPRCAICWMAQQRVQGHFFRKANFDHFKVVSPPTIQLYHPCCSTILPPYYPNSKSLPPYYLIVLLLTAYLLYCQLNTQRLERLCESCPIKMNSDTCLPTVSLVSRFYTLIYQWVTSIE